MKHNPDDRSDNAEKIQYNIDKTIQNIVLAEDMISETDDLKTKDTLEDKNERRRSSLETMRNEIKEEATYRENK